VAAPCPNCGSERTRRGGQVIWAIYLALIAAALISVLILHLHAGLIAAVMLAVIVLANLVIEQRVCPDCGRQWTDRRSKDG
jgi:predicted RNA-binding Zn-ribbon protein involved in translation (DUF1610 family)